MNNTQVLGDQQNEIVQQGSRWLATFTRSAPLDLPGYMGQGVGAHGRAQTLYLGSETDYTLPVCAEQASTNVIFDGELFNHQELQDELGDQIKPAINDAEIILAGYQRWGQDFLSRLRGSFALIIWDNSREVLLCLRDPLGSHPLFYTNARDELLLSPSIEVLLQHPHVSRALNRPAMVDHFLDRYPRLEETFHDAVSRVPPGHVLQVTREGRRAFRYWDPAPDGEVKWITEGAEDRFEVLFEQAV